MTKDGLYKAEREVCDAVNAGVRFTVDVFRDGVGGASFEVFRDDGADVTLEHALTLMILMGVRCSDQARLQVDAFKGLVPS